MPGATRVETPEFTGKAGETHDTGKIVLINTSGYLAGRVVGTDGKPIAGAELFNRGDEPSAWRRRAIPRASSGSGHVPGPEVRVYS